MPQYLSAKEFRARIPSIPDDLKRWKEIIVLKKSRPVFKVVPFEETPTDLLDRAEAIRDTVQPELQEIARIVHKIREAV
jgi:antitoxin (DNA-binding transcriptional repressor) of toxin-antitoxin stability system